MSPTHSREARQEWQPWTGEYEKQSYDVWVKGCDVVLGCWPNAGRMCAVDGSGREWKPGEVLAVRVSEFQGCYPSPRSFAGEDRDYPLQRAVSERQEGR